MEEPQGFEKIRQQADKIAVKHEKIRNTLDQAVQKAEKEKHRIIDIRQNLLLLIQMVRSYYKKEYSRVPWKTILYALAAIVYFLNPFDVIPDLLPALGFLDDATVVAFVVNAIKEDMELFRQFSRGNIPPA